MIKLRIRKYDKDKNIIEEVIETHLEYDGKFITEEIKELGLFAKWIPTIAFDGWEPIEKIE